MASSNGEQHADPARAGVDWSGWEAWRTSHEEILLGTVSELIGETVGDATGRLKQRVKALELQLATALGALDVLRGRGSPTAMRFKGTHSAGATYLALDAVTRESGSFVALKDSPGPCPGDGWQMLACGGKRGPQGERGPAGPPGTPAKFSGARFGKSGMEIVASDGSVVPLIKNISVDVESFALRLVAGDDSSLTVSLLPLFRKFQAETRS